MDSLLIRNAQIPGFQGLQQMAVSEGVIAAIAPMSASPILSASRVLDVEGDWLSLGGVDLQINGALGLAFPDLTLEQEDKLAAISEFLWQQGVDGFLPTIVTTSVENIHRSLATIAHYLDQPDRPMRKAAQILGVHLEGPFLNPQKRGAHPQEYLLPLTVEQVKQVLGDFAAMVKIVTLAPELDPTGEAIAYLTSLGITVSLGHSQATAAQAQQAFTQGATLVTHAFNAMPSLHHRQPGLLAAAIVHPHVSCGLIADGQHVVPLMLDLLLRASQYDRGLFLVSDALAPLGLPDGVYPWDARQIEVRQGTARLQDGTLAGTTLPLLVGVQNLVHWQLCDVGTAIALATTAPRHALAIASTASKTSSVEYLHQPAALLRWQWQASTHILTYQRLNLDDF